MMTKEIASLDTDMVGDRSDHRGSFDYEPCRGPKGPRSVIDFSFRFPKYIIVKRSEVLYYDKGVLDSVV